FLGTEPRIRNRIQRSLELKRKYALARHARVLGLSHASDGGLFFQ
ncbi:hypothetical protein chiPu_0030607, partial [Chiloscyllium punctatum]|nr:hypothetical protein [Chiloscyllium punctatum]